METTLDSKIHLVPTKNVSKNLDPADNKITIDKRSRYKGISYSFRNDNLPITMAFLKSLFGGVSMGHECFHYL